MATPEDFDLKGTRQMRNLRTLDEISWYAVSTRSRQEKAAASLLEYRGVPYFLPLINVTRQWSDRRQTIDMPLFPGYIFVQIPLLSDVRMRVLKVPGIVKFVGNQEGPQAIPTEQIEGVRTVLSKGVECTSGLLLNVGDRVRMKRGPLAGIEGTLMRIGAESKLVLSVEMIQRSIAITVQSSDVEPLVSSEPYLEMSA